MVQTECMYDEEIPRYKLLFLNTYHLATLYVWQ
jgi:hypothetical protein